MTNTTQTDLLDGAVRQEFDSWFKDYYGFVDNANAIEFQQVLNVFGLREAYETSLIAWKFAVEASRKQVLLAAADIADNGVVSGHHGNDVMTRHNIGSELRRMALEPAGVDKGEKE